MSDHEGSNDRGDADHRKEGRRADEDAALRARLSNLSKALDQHDHSSEPEVIKVPDLSGKSLGAANLGFRALVEFVTAIVVGTLIGWQIDKWAHTGPLFLIIFLLVGMAAGMLSTYRIALAPTKRD
jgi:ATP synthase protein I